MKFVEFVRTICSDPSCPRRRRPSVSGGMLDSNRDEREGCCQSVTHTV